MCYPPSRTVNIQPALTTLASKHAQKKPDIRPVSYVTMVVGSIYCDKIVHTQVHLLSTIGQTCIKAYSHECLNSNKALIYQIEDTETETVNFKM